MLVLHLAWRYACSRWVNLVAVLAVALALTVQIVVMAVLDGQIDFAQERIRNLGEQVAIHPKHNGPSRAAFPAVAARLEAVAGVRGVTPRVRALCLLEYDNSTHPLEITGIDLASEVRFSQLPEHMLHVVLDRDAPTWEHYDTPAMRHPGLFLGRGVANALGIDPPVEAHLLYQKPGDQGFVRQPVVVTSAFASGSWRADDYGAFVPLETAQEVRFQSWPEDERDRISIFSVWLDDIYAAERLERPLVDATRAAMKLPYPPESTTWIRRWESIAKGMVHENRLQEIILVLMNLSGGFCVFAILATLVSGRLRDVGLLRCIGATRGTVVSVFLLVGLMIGMVGSAVGLGGAVFLTSHTTLKGTYDDGTTYERVAPRIDAYFEKITGTPMYPPRMYGIQGAKGLPVKLTWPKIRLYVLGAVLISVLAAAYPALLAGRVEPVEALHNE